MLIYALEEATLAATCHLQRLQKCLLMRSTATATTTSAFKVLTPVHGEDGLGVAERCRTQVNHIVAWR